jgi:hypothetical protein
VDETPNLGLPYIMAAQSQKHVTHNEAIRALDAIVQLSVLDRDLSSPPSTPADGARYIVGPSPAGAWSGHALEVAAHQDGAWMFYPPSEGWIAWVADEDGAVVWSGSAWTTLTTGGGGSPDPTPEFETVGINATADTTNRLSLNSAASLFNHDGAGHQLKLNKAAAGDTASLLYQDNFSGRAELGLAGDDDFHFKVSADGSTWHEAILINRSTGGVTLPNTSIAGGVAGPVSSTDGNVTLFDGTSGGTIKDSGKAISTDGTLAANCDAKVPTEKAVRTFVLATRDALLAAAPGALDTLDELAAALGDDANFAATVTTALAGKQAADSDLTAIAALSPSNDDVIQRKSGAWSNRTPAQLAADLPSFTGDSGSGGVKGAVPAPASGDAAAGKFLKANGTWAAPVITVSATDKLLGRATAGAGAVEEITCTAFGRSLLDAADASTARSTLGLTIGTNIQAYSPFLADIAAMVPEDGETIVWNSVSGHYESALVEGGGGGGGAPSDAEYLVKSSSGLLSAERVVTDTSTIAWDWATGGQAKASVVDDSVTYAKLQNVSATARILGRKTVSAGDAEECTLSDILDFIGSAAQGDILYRGASAWARLGAGTAHQVLATGGAAANPSWSTPFAGHTWQDVSGSRALAASYQNTTGRDIAVSISLYNNNDTGQSVFALEVSTDNSTWIVTGRGVTANNDNGIPGLTCVVPPTHYYRLRKVSGNNTAAAVQHWSELR